MRTKTLLIASAALAAGILASSAQTYSQNIVGYANVASLAASQSYLLTCPFAVGVSNGANEVFGLSLPSGSLVLTWDSVGQSYTTVVFDTSDPQGIGPGAPVWYLDNDWDPATIPVLPVGQGFYLNPTAPVTNTFAGAVAVAVGTSNNMVFPSGSISYLVSCAVPYAGPVTNGTSSTGGPNLNNLPTGSLVLTWNAGSQSYTTTVYDTSDPQGVGPGASLWYQDNDWDPAPCPTLTVGQGFFINPTAPFTWTTGL